MVEEILPYLKEHNGWRCTALKRKELKKLKKNGGF